MRRYCGPLPKAKGGYEFLLTYIDVGSRWPEAIPLKKATTQTVINALKTIFSRNGYPRIFVTDNGSQFTSRMFEKYCHMHGIDKVETATYRPKSNGIVEQIHGTLVLSFTSTVMG